MFDFFKKRKEKEKLDNIKKENASKIFNNTFLYKGANKLADEDLKPNGKVSEFFGGIDDDPKVVEYVFEHAPIIYDDSLLENAKQIRKYLEEDKTLSPIYSKYRESLKKEFDKQVKKLRISYIYKFWDNFGKKYMLKKHNAQFDIGEDLQKEIENWWKNLVDPKVCNDIYFNILDIGSYLLSAFDGLFRFVFLSYIGTVFNKFGRIAKKSPRKVGGLNDDYEKLKEKLITECYAKNFPESILKFISPDDINEAVVKYIKENKLTFEELIEKINDVLKLIANLKFDDINK